MSHPQRRPAAQRGVATVEFAMTVIILLVVMFGVMEIARVMYVWSTLTEVTRRYARELALTDFTDAAALAKARRRATFGSSDGGFPLSGPIKGDHFQVRYLQADQSPATMPLCPVQNIINCAADPNGANCIRFVEVRVCKPDGAEGACEHVTHTALVGMHGPTWAAFKYPTFATAAPVETLGYRPGAASSCP